MTGITARNAALTPAQSYDLLISGNRRFVDGSPEHPNQDSERRSSLAPVQHPFAVLFGCSDSRLAAEIIFDRGLGDLFVVRTAGHTVDSSSLGSIEYGIGPLDCKLLVVLGHDSCGAVGAATDVVDGAAPPGGYIRDLVERVTPSVLASRAAGETEPQQVIDTHVRITTELLLERSRMLSEQVEAGEVAVVGLSYQLADGRARLVSAHGAVGADLAGTAA